MIVNLIDQRKNELTANLIVHLNLVQKIGTFKAAEQPRFKSLLTVAVTAAELGRNQH